jgi:pyruvate/2-oxoglutarate dehydrogenase complex dihydrolipoamide acyltransferase (E2) component
MAVDVLIPPLAATTDTLLLVEWYRQEGETVTKDEPLFAVETDKATLDVEAPASGILRHVSAQPGAEVAALSRIAVILAPGEAWDEGRFAPVRGGRGGGGGGGWRPSPALPSCWASRGRR